VTSYLDRHLPLRRDRVHEEGAVDGAAPDLGLDRPTPALTDPHHVLRALDRDVWHYSVALAVLPLKIRSLRRFVFRISSAICRASRSSFTSAPALISIRYWLKSS